MKAEAVVGRLAELVQLCYTRAELFGVWHAVCHLNVLAEKEVRLRIGHVEFAPCVRFRDEGWHRFVELGHGVEFSFQHHSPRFFCCALEEP